MKCNLKSLLLQLIYILYTLAVIHDKWQCYYNTIISYVHILYIIVYNIMYTYIYTSHLLIRPTKWRQIWILIYVSITKPIYPFFFFTIFGFNIILNYKNTRTLVGLRIKNYTRKNKEFGKTLLIKKKNCLFC